MSWAYSISVYSTCTIPHRPGVPPISCVLSAAPRFAAWYALLLGKSNDLIDYGASLLLLVVDPGLICGFVVPVLEAFPGAAMVVFSGLGPPESVQLQLNVGMGSLAGSTVFLLTIPWAASVLAGRVDLDAAGKLFVYGVISMPSLLVPRDVFQAQRRSTQSALVLRWAGQ
jgi:hypothetical protein